jgi:sugar lactone lactonase YvrE
VLSLDDVAFAGHGLERPECVLCTRAGDLYTADFRGGVAHLDPSGQTRLYTGRSAELTTGLRPNGIALDRDGSFLVAHLGADEGGVFRLDRAGQVRSVLREVDGVSLPPSNFVLLDAAGRLWITVSTRLVPRARGYRKDNADGFIVLVDQHGARVVADELGYTNEVQVSPDGRWLYVNETFIRRTSRFALRPDATRPLGPRETVIEHGPGVFPDGLAFDAEGGLLIVSVVSNRVLRLAPGGKLDLWLEDNEPAHLAWVEEAYQAGKLDRSHLDTIKSRTLRNISSAAFGGADLRDLYLGCLLGDRIAHLRSPLAGLPPVHWEW